MLHTFLDRLPISWTVKFALLRLAARWRSLLTVIVGVILAAVIGANIPLYTSAVSQIGMIERLGQQPENIVHSIMRVTYNDPETPLSAFWATAVADVRSQVNVTLRDDAFPQWVDAVVSTAESAPLTYTDATDLRLATASDWRERVSITDGAFPVRTVTDVDLEAVISTLAAAELDVQVGDVLTLSEQRSGTEIRVRVSGLVRENNPEATYWVAPSLLRIDRNDNRLETNLLTDRDVLTQTIEAHLPEIRTRLGWKILFDYTQLRFEDTHHAITRLNQFEDGIEDLLGSDRSLSLVYENEVIPVLEDYREEVARLNAPLGLLLLQIGALVLLFLIVIVALVRRGERREIAMLQSRGSYDRQIILVRGVEAFIVCLLAVLVAPWLARQLLVWLVPLLVDVEHLPLAISFSTYLYAGVAAVAALIILVMTLRPVLKLPLVSAGGSALRGEKAPWWQRYYLDVVLMVLGLFGLWRLLDSNSTLVETEAGLSQADPLLLLTPALLFIAIGSLLLRLFPLTMRLFTDFIRRRRGLGGILAGWQVSREPVHYARITFLLALAVGIGWFATSFQATIVRSQADQSRYQVGADLRITEYDTIIAQPGTRPPADYQTIDGVETVTQARRLEIPAVVNGVSFDPGELLAVDFDTFDETAFWRDDLGKLKAPFNAAHPRIESDDRGEPLPFIPERITVRAIMPQPVLDDVGQIISENSLYRLARNTTIILNLRDETGTVFGIPMTEQRIEGEPDDETLTTLLGFVNNAGEFVAAVEATSGLPGWVTFAGAFDNLDYTPFGDITFQGLTILNERFVTERPTEFVIDEIQLIDAEGNTQSLDSLTDAEWFLQAPGVDEAEVEGAEIEGAASDQNLLLRWTTDDAFSNLTLSINPTSNDAIIPVLASNTFLEANNLEVGLEFPMALLRQDFTFVVIDEVAYYPTLYQEVRPFIVVDLTTLQNVIFNATGEFIQADETWLDLAPGTSESDIVQTLQLESDRFRVDSVSSFDEALAAYVADPLSQGLIGLLFLSFVVILLLSIISLLTYAGLTAQFRRSEFGVLQALGLSKMRIVFSMALEQLLVTGVAVLIGAIIGVILSTQALPTLASSITTQTITPPFVVRTETVALLQYAVVLGVVLVVVLVFTLLLIQRLSLAQAVKMGED